MVASSLAVLVLLAAAVADGGSPPAESAEHLWTGVSGGVQVSWTKERLVATREGKTTFVEELEPSDAVGCEDLEFRSQALSLVGPLLSRYREVGGDCGGAHPVCGTSYVTVDLRTGKDVDLFTLFGTKTVTNALRRDPYLRELLEKESGPEAGESFETLQQALRVHRHLRIDKAGFYVHHLEKDRVAVRVGLTASAHATCGERVELGLLLPIPPGLKEALERAASGAEGFVTRNRPKSFRWGMGVKGTPEEPLP